MSKSCVTCEHGSLGNNEGPCGPCFEKERYSNWEPKEAKGKKECATCKKGSKSTGYLCDIGLDKCDQSYGGWEPIETNINETILEKESNMDKNYEVIVQVRNKDGEITDSLNKGLPIMVVAESEKDADRWINRKYSVEIDTITQNGKLEIIIRPFLAS